MRASIHLLALTAAAFLGASAIACGATFDSAANDDERPAPNSAQVCPGTHLDSARIGECSEPYRIRHGRACDVDQVVCPSIDLLHGDCRCEAGAWSCTEPDLPHGYDPYPDCPDRGVARGGACYLEGSTCIPDTAATCFTSNVTLCTCSAHSWTCR